MFSVPLNQPPTENAPAEDSELAINAIAEASGRAANPSSSSMKRKIVAPRRAALDGGAHLGFPRHREKIKDVRARLGEGDDLPSIEQAARARRH